MNSLNLDNINKFTNLDDENVLNFEKRLLKNSNDYLDYINYLEKKTETTPEQYVYFYLRLLVVYKNETNVVITLWKYLIKLYNISNENATNVLSITFVEFILKNLSNASIISLLKYFGSSNQVVLKYYIFDAIMKLFDHERAVDIIESAELKNFSPVDNKYGALYNFTGYLPSICKFGTLSSPPAQKLQSKLILKYLTMLNVSEKNIKMSLVKRATAVEYLKSLHDFDSLYLYFDKLEKDSLQFVYYAILKLLSDEGFKKTGKPVMNKINQLLSSGLKKLNSSDVFVLQWLYSLVSQENIKINALIKDINHAIQNFDRIDHFEAYYDILVQLLKCIYIESADKADSEKMLETTINAFESKRMMCLLKENITNFQYWRHFLNTNQFNKESLEFFLETVELNSNKTYSLKNVLPGELGKIWTSYAEIFSKDINSYRTVIKCSLNMNYFYYQDVEMILLNWLSKEQGMGNQADFDKLINKFVNYTEMGNKNDNVAKTLQSSKKLWNYLINQCEDKSKVIVYNKMVQYQLLTTKTVEYITDFVLNHLKDKSVYFELWLHAFADLFIQFDKDLKTMFEIFTLQSSSLQLFEKNALTTQILKNIINKVDLNKKEFWIKKYVDLITENKMESSEKIFTLSNTITYYMPIFKSYYLLEKWVELISNIKINSLSPEFLAKIRFIDLPEILETYNGLEIISSKLPSSLIAFESMFSDNVDRIRELYIYFAQLLPPSYNIDMENLWKSWEDFEITNGKLKDLIRWRKDITTTFQQLGYQRSSTTTKIDNADSNHIEFVKARSIKTDNYEDNLLKPKEED